MVIFDTFDFFMVEHPAKGTAEMTDENTGEFIYTPDENVNGDDSFTFQVSDGFSESNISTVNISIRAVNDVPLVKDVSKIGNEDTADSDTLAPTGVGRGR